MKKLFLICSLFFFLLNNYAQEQNILQSKLEKFYNENPQEKVFLQSDKQYYFSGETIWMKAWCTLEGVPTYLSKILYIDLVNEKGDVILKKMFKLDSLSSTVGEFDISSQLSEGNYSINAYTLWMLNYPSFIARKNIFIFSSTKKAATTNNKPAEIKMSFFPEGGNIIANSKSRVAFKIYDTKGYSLNLKGTITDSKGNNLSNFEGVHDGMGIIELEAKKSETYYANISNSNGVTLQFKLPEVIEEGISLKVENNNPNRLFVVCNRGETNKQKYNQLKLAAQINNQLVYFSNINFDEGQSVASISKKNLPPGILQITLLDTNNIPLAERLAFIENYEVSKTAISLDTINMKFRGKNQISFSLDNIKPSISVAVTSFLNNEETSIEDNIASSLLLTSDIKGYVNNPGYYFKDKTPSTLKHLDLLLMTQGWKRFSWKKIMNNENEIIKYPVESSISIRGTVLKSDRNTPIKDGYVAFIIRGEDSTRIMANATATDKGEFILNDLEYKKKATISYQGTNNKKDKLIVDVKLNDTYIDSLKKSINKPTYNLDTIDINNKNSAWTNYINAKKYAYDTTNTTYLGNVTVVAKKRSRVDSLNDEYATGFFAMGSSIDPSEYKNVFTIWQMLQQSVPGITVEGNPYDPTVYFNRFRGANTFSQNSSSVEVGSSSDGSVSVGITLAENGIAYFLNDINVDKDVINTLSVEDVALIKVLKNEGFLLGANMGALAFYTKKGVANRTTIYDKTFTNIQREGYAIVRQFYSIDYSIPENLKNTDKDSRYTLYWNGNIQPRKDGTYRFSFYNSDISHKVKLLIQGIDFKGKIVFHEQIIQ